MKYIARLNTSKLKKYIDNFPVLAILGPRQCGKSTLAKQLLQSYNSIYLDLENPDDLAKLAEPILFFNQHKDKIICLDEIQRLPEIFTILRSIIDDNNRNAQFILLGSASPQLLKQTSETLAGRIVYHELTPFLQSELPIIYTKDAISSYWFRGGFPRSVLAIDNEISEVWRKNFILTFLEKDIPNLGFGYSPEKIRRLWQMIAHSQGQLVNLSELGKSLGISHTMIRQYIDLLEQTYMIRVLQPYFGNTKKRITKTPKIYIRDTGILHSLLRISSPEIILGHPVAGSSWETMVIENIISQTSDYTHSFYRTSNGNEIDLILENGTNTFAIECKLSSAPKLSRSFYSVLDDVKAKFAWVVAPVNDSYLIKENVKVCNLETIIKDLTKKN
jgi:predicted AAA+ superfamily ATPase